MPLQVKIQSHPVLPPPSLDQILAEADLGKSTQEEALGRLLARRRQVIDAEKADPFRNGWEPHIWHVCDALLDFDEWCCDAGFTHDLNARLGIGWNEFKVQMREHLGFQAPISMLLIMGANRASKSEYSAKRGQQVLSYVNDSRVFPLHMSNPRSVAEQQPLFWKFMPQEYKVQAATTTTYIKYKEKTGFSDNSFINPVSSFCEFKNYMQDKDTCLEGIEPDLVLPDELIPADWVETLHFRLTTRNGKGIITFTPIRGYTPAVKMFRDSSVQTKKSIAFMLPKDRGDPLEHLVLGLSEDEYKEIVAAERDKRVSLVPQSRPDDVIAWLEGGTGQPPIPEGRKFEMVPRVERCVDPRCAVVYFHACDNPYGNPKNVIGAARLTGPDNIRIRLYGKADRIGSTILPKFSRDVHVLDPAAIPEEGTNYCFIDPASDRNFFLTWIRATPEASYVYREWPGTDEIPGEGMPDPWSVPSGKKEGINDGKRGGGQESFGFGLIRYMFEMARLERWGDYMRWVDENGGSELPVIQGNLYPSEDLIMDWDDGGALEIIEDRYVDSRAASAPRVEHDRPVTLFEDLIELGLNVHLTPGSHINDGVARINSALDFEWADKQSFFNKPKLYIGENCPNTIYSFENWMNVERDGACKDPIDNVRYFFTAECDYNEEDAYEPRHGFHYGRGNRSVSSSVQSRPRRPAVMGPRRKVIVKLT